MGVSHPHVLGREARYFNLTETTFGTGNFPAENGGKQFKGVTSSSFSHSKDRQVRADARSTRSTLEHITGKTTNEWSIEKYVLPSGTAGTPPDDHELLLAAIGGTTGYTNTPSTSDAYALTNAQTARGSVTLVRHFGNASTADTYMETLVGAYVKEFKISCQTNGQPMFTYSGGAKSYLPTGYSTTASGTSSLTQTVATGFGRNFVVGSRIRFHTDDGTDNAGYAVASVSSDTIVVTSNGTPNTTTGQGIYPHAPADTTAGSPISNNLGSLTLDFASGNDPAISVTGYEINVNHNVEEVNDQLYEAEVSDFVDGYREITGQFTMRARRDWMITLAQRNNFIAATYTMVHGTTAGSILTVVCRCELGFSEIEIPQAEVATITVPFRGLATSAENELTVTFT